MNTNINGNNKSTEMIKKIVTFSIDETLIDYEKAISELDDLSKDILDSKES